MLTAKQLLEKGWDRDDKGLWVHPKCWMRDVATGKIVIITHTLTQRHRFFETSFIVNPPSACDHSKIPLLVTTASKASREKRFKLGMQPKTVKNALAAYGIDWMNFAGLKEAIPPAYAEYIGRRVHG